MKKNSEKGVNVAMVGYYNTLPFLYGLKGNKDFNLILDIPSKCIDYFDQGEADIALVPVATLLNREDFKIVTDYCIGCNGEVKTVCVFSNGPLDATITKIYLDKDSRTSQMLVKLLCYKFWKIDPEFEECNVRNTQPQILKSNEAVLMIGDKVFEMSQPFANKYDLGMEWQKLTGLPFTFAVWIARKNVHQSIIDKLNQSIKLGVLDVEAVLSENQGLTTKIDLAEYFKTYIDYRFDSDKKKALKLFYEHNKISLF
ncbi:MAG: menaquinone biosynthesis protein [Bacteroidota bacterium]